jgi:penicillin-binding protein 2
MLFFDEIKKGDPHLRGVAIAVALGLSVLIAGLWYVQVVCANRYRADLQEQSLRIVRVPAIRGKILDRNGFALAENRPTYNVNLYLEEFRRYFRYEYTNSVLPQYRRTHPDTRPNLKTDEVLQCAARCRVVSNLLLHVSSLVRQPQTLDEKLFTNHYNNLRSLPFPLLRDLSVQQVALFSEKSGLLPSLSLEVQPLRTYPWTNTAAHVLGHLKRENNPAEDEDISFQFRLEDYAGAMGVELAFDQQLRGRPGVKSVLVNNLQYRQGEEILMAPQPGQNVVLTIDLPTQRATERALRNVNAEPRGAAVVMDCRTGDVLAMASVPSFDPNLFTAAHIPEEEYDKLMDLELRPQINRATYGVYPPGSIFKIIVSMAGLEAGLIHTNDEFEARTFYQINGKGHPWSCTAPAGKYDFDKAFYLSCNCYFIDHGLQIGFEKIADMGRRFGLGSRTGFTTRLESAGYFPDPSEKIKKDGTRWMPGDTANLCIGQGEILVTPLQVAVMTAAIANGGKVLEPRLVDRIEPPDPTTGGDTVRFPAGQIRRQLNLDPRNLAIVREAMQLDVTHRDEKGRRDGTGRYAAVEGMQVCGKTGTAQVMEGHILKEHITWFVSFAPFDNPRYAVVIVVEGGTSGGGTCAPVAHDIYKAILERAQGAPLKPEHSVALN